MKTVVMEGHRESGKRRPKCMTQGRFDHESPSYRDDGFTQHVSLTAQVKACPLAVIKLEMWPVSFFRHLYQSLWSWENGQH